MGSNRCSSKCDCGYQFNLGSFRGQFIEFRKTSDYAPIMGCKLICPCCNKVYFGWIRHEHEFWGRESLDQFDQEFIHCHILGTRKNHNRGKFAKRITIPPILNDGKSEEKAIELGCNEIDTAYYESGRDEGEGIDTETPSYLFTDDTDFLTDKWD